MKKTNTSWGEVADWYQELVVREDSYQNRVILPNLDRLVAAQATDKILDIACGSGFFTGHFAKKAQMIQGVDISPELITLAAKHYPGVKFTATPANNLKKFETGTFSKVMMILALQNIEDVKGTLAEMHRVLNAQGKVFLVLNHPAFRIPKASSWGWDEEQKKQYRRVDSYLHESKIPIVMNPGEARKTETISFHRPLQYYFKQFFAAGFTVARLEEWISDRSSQQGPRQAEEDRTRREIPLFLFLELRKQA